MKALPAVLFAGLGLLAPHFCAAVPPTPRESALAAGNLDFACGLYGELAGGPGNLFLSPCSISTALAMTWGGAKGDTAAQMRKTLRFGLPDDDLHQAFAELQQRLNAAESRGKMRLRVANSIWPQKDYPFRKEYVTLLKDRYGVSVTPVDYVGAAESARGLINGWVSDRTEKKIQNLIPSGVLNNMTRLVLANAIYFKGTWATPFDKAATQDADFRLEGGRTAKAPFMYQESEHGYAESASLQALDLGYRGGDLSMVVLLPRRSDGLATLEKDLSPAKLTDWLRETTPRKVRVFLPRFKMTYRFSVKESLLKLGMTDAFDPGKADFSGMGGKPHDLFISAVLHKAFVDVNEEGTEAAAATAVIISRAMAFATPPPEFRADHPFLFLIREKATGSILFLGRVADPTAAGE